MGKIYNEEECIKSLSKVAKVNTRDFTITLSKQRINDGQVGIKRWGMIDFLRNHRNWIVLYDNSAGVGSDVSIEHTIKKDKKEKHKLTDKRSK